MMKKPLITLGHLSILITAILAIIFYKERVLFADSGQLIFEMINEGKCKVFLNRYSMLISESLPWLAIKIGLPLKPILIIYSLSFILIYYLCFLLCVYVFKNIPAGLAIAFAPLIIRLAFGQSVCESWMGVAYSALFYAIINHFHVFKKKGPLFLVMFYLLSLFILALNYFMHPITLFMLIFSIGFTLINNKEFRSPHLYILTIATFMVFLLKFLFPGHPYEENYFEGLKHPAKILPFILETPIVLFFARSFFTTYVYFVILLVISGILYFKSKKVLPFVFTITFCLGYIIINALSSYKGDAAYLLETRLIPLVLMAVITFIEIIKEKKAHVFLISGILILLVGSFISLSILVKKVHTKRIETYSYFLKEAEKHSGTKFFVHLPNDRNTPLNSWGSAAETLMLSSLEGSSNSKTIIFINDQMHIEEGINSYPCIFLWLQWRLYANEVYLNKKYFNLNCTKYEELKYPNDLYFHKLFNSFFLYKTI